MIRTRGWKVKFLDPSQTDGCEGVSRERFHWSRAKEAGSKTIRYRCSCFRKRFRLAIGKVHFWPYQQLPRNQSFCSPGGVWLQSWNLKKLTEGHHQAWSLRLNLTQHGTTCPARTQEWLTDWELFLDSVGGGAWPFLVGGAICLVNSDNERDSGMLNSHGSNFNSPWDFLEGQVILITRDWAITGLWCP